MVVDLSYIVNPMNFVIIVIVTIVGIPCILAAQMIYPLHYEDKRKRRISYILVGVSVLSMLTCLIYIVINHLYVYPGREAALKSCIEEQYKAKAVREGDMFYLFDESGNSLGTVTFGETEKSGKYVVCKAE